MRTPYEICRKLWKFLYIGYPLTEENFEKMNEFYGRNDYYGDSTLVSEYVGLWHCFFEVRELAKQ